VQSSYDLGEERVWGTVTERMHGSKGKVHVWGGRARHMLMDGDGDDSHSVPLVTIVPVVSVVTIFLGVSGGTNNFACQGATGRGDGACGNYVRCAGGDHDTA